MLNSVYIENFFTILLPPPPTTIHGSQYRRNVHNTTYSITVHLPGGGGREQQLGTVAYSYYCIFHTRNKKYSCVVVYNVSQRNV
jgi:hypothetical protein